MFRRKDEAYDSDDLLEDVMPGGEDDMFHTDDSASQSSSGSSRQQSFTPKPPVAPANNNQSSTTAFKPQAQPSESTSSAPAAAAATKPSPAAAFRPQAAPAAATTAARSLTPSERSAPSVSANPKASKRVLTVGHDIHMEGKISTCDRLVIEGSVDAELQDVHTVEIAQSGAFKGTAEIEDAEISGSFEGDLIVHGRLIIYSTGRVSGNVSYGEIEIERGGQLTGSIQTVDQIQSERSAPATQKKAA